VFLQVHECLMNKPYAKSDSTSDGGTGAHPKRLHRDETRIQFQAATLTNG